MNECRKTKLTTRWHFIDLMETIGLLFVLMYHVDTYDYNIQGNAGLLIYFRYYLRTILSTSVPMFFFANGYLFFNRDFQLKKHIRKTVKLVILSVIWGILGLLILMLIEGQYFTLKEFVLNLIRLKPIGWINHLWFMEVLVFIYIFAPLLKKMYESDKKYRILFTAFLGILTILNCIISYGSGIIPDTVLNNGFVHIENVFFTTIRGFSVIFFCAGGMAKEYENRIRSINHINIIAVVGILISCSLLCVYGIRLTEIQGAQWDVVYDGYYTVFTFINVICIYILALNYKGNIKTIKLISCNTLGIYYIQNILINLTKDYALNISIFCNFFGNMLYAASLILIGLLIVIGMKKIPLIRNLVML